MTDQPTTPQPGTEQQADTAVTLVHSTDRKGEHPIKVRPDQVALYAAEGWRKPTADAPASDEPAPPAEAGSTPAAEDPLATPTPDPAPAGQDSDAPATSTRSRHK